MSIKDKVRAVRDKVERDENLKGLLSTGFYGVLIKVAGMLAMFVFGIFLARIGGAEAYGDFALARTVIRLVAIFSLLGMDKYFLRAFSGEWHNSRTKNGAFINIMLFNIFNILLLGAGLALAAYGGLLPFELRFNDFVEIMVFSSLTSFIVGFSTYLQSDSQATLSILFYHSLIPFCSLLVLVLLYYSRWDLGVEIGTIAFYLAIGISALMVLAYSLYIGIGTIDAGQIGFRNLKETVKESWPIFLGVTSTLIINWTDQLMIAYFLGKPELGVFNVAFKIGMLAILPLNILNAYIFPKCSTYYRAGRFADFKKFVLESSKLSFWLTLIASILLLSLSTWFLVLHGQEFQEGRYCAFIMILGQLINGASGITFITLVTSDHANVLRNIFLGFAAFNFVLNIQLIPALGIEGAAISSAVTYFCTNLIAILYIKRVHHFYIFQNYLNIKTLNLIR